MVKTVFNIAAIAALLFLSLFSAKSRLALRLLVYLMELVVEMLDKQQPILGRFETRSKEGDLLDAVNIYVAPKEYGSLMERLKSLREAQDALLKENETLKQLLNSSGKPNNH